MKHSLLLQEKAERCRNGKAAVLLTQPLLRRENFPVFLSAVVSDQQVKVTHKGAQDTNPVLHAAQLRKAGSTNTATGRGEHLLLVCARTMLCFCWMFCMGDGRISSVHPVLLHKTVYDHILPSNFLSTHISFQPSSIKFLRIFHLKQADFHLM